MIVEDLLPMKLHLLTTAIATRKNTAKISLSKLDLWSSWGNMGEQGFIKRQKVKTS